MRNFWKSVTVVAAGLAAGQAHGQAFEKGYVVTAAGDTVRGEIEDRSWQAPPESIVFRAAPGASAQTYSRRQLQAFRLEGGRYFRAEVVPLDRGAQTQLNSLPRKMIINPQPDSLLAEVLVDGPVPLLRAIVDDVSHYFVRRPGQPYLELTQRRYLAFINGTERIVDANNYRSQLTVYFGDCPPAVAAAEAAPFSAKGLANVVQTFSVQCTAGKQPGADYLATPRKHQAFALNGGVLAGGAYNILGLKNTETGEEQPLLNGLNLDGRLHPVGGVYLDVMLPGRRWVAHGEGTFSTFGRRGTFSLAGGAGSYRWYGNKLDFRLGPRYLLKQAAQGEWFVGAGLNFNGTLGYASREEYGTGGTRITAQGVRVPTQSTFIGPPAFGLGPYLETGVRRGRLTLSLDAMLGEGVSYTDPLTVQSAIRDSTAPAGSNVISYNGFSYGASLFAFRAMLGVRIGPEMR